MFLSGGILAIIVGIFCWTDSDFAWRMYELDCQMWGQHVEQPHDWRERVQYMGVVLMILGAMAVVAAIRLF